MQAMQAAMMQQQAAYDEDQYGDEGNEEGEDPDYYEYDQVAAAQQY